MKKLLLSNVNLEGTISDANTYFYQMCIFPRCIFSIADAIYTANFIILLHRIKTNNFSTIHILDKIFTNMFPVLISFTEVETKLFGRFIRTLLEVVMKWHSSIQIYEKECYNHPCFSLFGKNQLKTDVDCESSDQISADTIQSLNSRNLNSDFEQYRLVVFKWHSRMTKVFNLFIY